MSFYKGYVRTKNKRCIDKFGAGAPLFKLDDVKDLDEYAGVIAGDCVLIDVDDMESARKLLEIVKEAKWHCKVTESRKGMHFLWKLHAKIGCKTGTNLGCGITADIKDGHAACYEVLKIDGVERPVLYDEAPYEELPRMLYPVKSSVDWVHLTEGRNQALYSYILSLQSAGFSKDEVTDTILCINKFVLPSPLGDDEMQKILREEAFSAPIFFIGKKFLFAKFAMYLMQKHCVRRINGALHIYKDGIYTTGVNLIRNAMLQELPELSFNQRQETLRYLEDYITDDTDEAGVEYIAFKNGVYNYETNELLPFSPNLVLTNKVPWNYNESAYNHSVDTVLNNIANGDKSIRAMLEEIIGYCLLRRNELGKAFVLVGDGSNGKSTFLKMLRRMLGSENVSVLSMQQMSDKFSSWELMNKLANVGDDIPDDFIADTSLFKKVTTGEAIKAERKGENTFYFTPYCKLIFSANNIPRIGKGRDSEAILRRLLIVPFTAKFKEGDGSYNAYISDQLKSDEGMEYLINLGIDGLLDVLDRQAFTKSESVISELDSFEASNNPIVGFFEEVDLVDIDGHIATDVYKRYQKYAYDNGINAVSNVEFGKQVKKRYGVTSMVKRINGKSCRVFVTE